MIKIKIAVIAFVLSVIGVALFSSAKQKVSASSEVFEEIAKYKSWKKINSEPIAVKIAESFAGG